MFWKNILKRQINLQVSSRRWNAFQNFSYRICLTTVKNVWDLACLYLTVRTAQKPAICITEVSNMSFEKQ